MGQCCTASRFSAYHKADIPQKISRRRGSVDDLVGEDYVIDEADLGIDLDVDEDYDEDAEYGSNYNGVTLQDEEDSDLKEEKKETEKPTKSKKTDKTDRKKKKKDKRKRSSSGCQVPIDCGEDILSSPVSPVGSPLSSKRSTKRSAAPSSTDSDGDSRNDSSSSDDSDSSDSRRHKKKKSQSKRSPHKTRSSSPDSARRNKERGRSERAASPSSPRGRSSGNKSKTPKSSKSKSSKSRRDRGRESGDRRGKSSKSGSRRERSQSVERDTRSRKKKHGAATAPSSPKAGHISSDSDSNGQVIKYTADSKSPSDSKYFPVTTEHLKKLGALALKGNDGWKECTSGEVEVHRLCIKGDPIDVVRSKATLDFPIPVICTVVNDTAMRPQWDENVSHYEILEHLSEDRDVYYMINKMPFIFSDRDWVEYRKVFVTKSMIAIICFATEHKDKPEGSRMTRGHTILGGHIFRPTPDGKRTEAYFVSKSDMRGDIPTAMVNKASSAGVKSWVETLNKACARYIKGDLGKPVDRTPSGKLKWQIDLRKSSSSSSSSSSSKSKKRRKRRK